MKRERAAYLNAKLIAAIRREDVEGVRNWLNDGASPNGRHRSIFARFFRGDELSPLVEAIRSRSPEIVRVLLEAGADPQEKGVLVSACWDEDVEILELLIAFDASPGARELQIAVQRNEVSVVKFLLGQKVDVDKSTLIFLQEQWWRKSGELLELFEEHGFDYDAEKKELIARRDEKRRLYYSKIGERNTKAKGTDQNPE